MVRYIRIHRKAYCKKPFVRKTGTKVKGFCLPATTFVEKAKFATAGQRLPFKVKKGKLTKFGYHAHLPVGVRRAALRKASRAYGSIKLWRMLNVQGLYRKRFADGTKEAFLSDRDWVRNNLMSETEARKMTRPAVQEWKRMPHYQRVLARAGI
jgi:hypothetical protein